MQTDASDDGLGAALIQFNNKGENKLLLVLVVVKLPRRKFIQLLRKNV